MADTKKDSKTRRRKAIMERMLREAQTGKKGKAGAKVPKGGKKQEKKEKVEAPAWPKRSARPVFAKPQPVPVGKTASVGKKEALGRAMAKLSLPPLPAPPKPGAKAMTAPPPKPKLIPLATQPKAMPIPPSAPPRPSTPPSRPLKRAVSMPVIAPVMASKPTARKVKRARPTVNIVRVVAKRISHSFPNLRKKLREAGMDDDPVTFIQKSLVMTIMMSVMFTVLFFFILDTMGVSLTLLGILFPLFLLISFMWRMQYPVAKAKKRAREVDRELVFAGRQMLIELKAGVPLFDALLSISRDYGEISKEFTKIVERVNAGIPTDMAMHDVAEDNPSMAFKRVILQLINSIRSGSDVAKALGAVLDQISREQITELKAYGQKLNPLGMFYMVFGIILPSLGIALAIIIFSFLSVNLDLTILYSILLVIAIIQYIFVTIIESQKPQYEF